MPRTSLLAVLIAALLIGALLGGALQAWIWFGAIIMALGGIVTVDPRSGSVPARQVPAPSGRSLQA